MVSIVPSFWRNNALDSTKGFFIAFCGCLIVACVFGTGNSYPEFTKKIKDDPAFASNPPSETILALASSFIYGVNCVFSITSGILIPYLGTRIICVICACFLFISFFISSFISDYHGVVLTLGVLMCVAYGIVLNAPAVTASTWFSLKKPVGMGIVYAGAGLGMLTIPIMVGQLIEVHGWRSTLRRVAAVSVVALFASLFMVQREGTEEKNDQVGDDEKKNNVQGKDTASGDLKAGSGVIDISSADNAINADENNKENEDKKSECKDNECIEENIEKSDDNNKADDKVPEVPSSGEVINVSNITHEPDYLRTSGIDIVNAHRCINTHKATLKEFIFKLLLSKAYISLFMAYVLYSIGFFGELYFIVPYPAFWIGKKGTIYEDSPKISLQNAAFGSLAYGLGRLTGGPIAGFIATKLTDRYTYALFSFIHGVLQAILIAARPLYVFIILYYMMGFCIGAFYATYFSLVTRRFYGPNLGLAMGIVVVASLPGGFCSPLITASMLDKYQNFTYAFIIFVIAYLASSILVLVTMEDRIGHPIVVGEGIRQLQARRQKLANLSRLSFSHVPVIPNDTSKSFILFKKKLFRE